MKVDVKDHIQVVMFPVTSYKREDLIKLSDSSLLNLVQIGEKRGAKIYPGLYSFQTALNLDLVDTTKYYIFFLDI
jgi:hypothetical protein